MFLLLRVATATAHSTLMLQMRKLIYRNHALKVTQKTAYVKAEVLFLPHCSSAIRISGAAFALGGSTPLSSSLEQLRPWIGVFSSKTMVLLHHQTGQLELEIKHRTLPALTLWVHGEWWSFCSALPGSPWEVACSSLWLQKTLIVTATQMSLSAWPQLIFRANIIIFWWFLWWKNEDN